VGLSAMKRYQIIGCSSEEGLTAGYDDHTQLHETDSYEEAKGWLSGYVRFDGLKQSGYAYIMIRKFETRSFFDQSGWTHY